MKKQIAMENIATTKGKMIYERKATDSLYSEELEFHQYRKKKLKSMDKKSKHLLLFSNINQLNFTDINKQNKAKAWTVLYHFRSKSHDSLIYEEFETLAMRNSVGKSKGHEFFHKFYMKLIEKSMVHEFRVLLSSKDETSGWPIDIQVSLHTGMKKYKKIAFYFFLQEEVCLSTKTGFEEPLGLQQLMLQHLKSVSEYNIKFLTENDFYMNKENTDDFIN